MSETNGDLDDIVNSARVTSFVISREIYSEKEDDIYVDPYVNDDIYLSELSGETIPLEQASNKKKRLPNEPVPPAKKVKLVVKPPHKKGQVIRSQTQGLGMLASSIKSLAQQQSLRHEREMQANKKCDEDFFKFKAEQREIDRQHEMNMLSMLLNFQGNAYGTASTPTLHSPVNAQIHSPPYSQIYSPPNAHFYSPPPNQQMYSPPNSQQEPRRVDSRLSSSQQ